MPPRFEIRLPSEQTADAVGIVEITVPAGWDGPPLHHHDGVRTTRRRLDAFLPQLLPR